MRVGTLLAEGGADDMGALAAAGVGHVRINVGWSRLQPRAGTWDERAAEAVATTADAARTEGLAPWYALLGTRLPPWFDDEGGFADSKTAGRWWPRYVEGIAERLGDGAGGWFPLVDPAVLAATALAGRDEAAVREGRRAVIIAWRDAWRILRGPAPVATALPVDDREWPRVLRTGEPGLSGLELDDLAESCDLFGALTTVAPGDDAEALAERLVQFAAEGPDRPLALTARLDGKEDEERATAAETTAAALGMAAADGVTIGAAFAWPLLDDDGAPGATAEAWAALPR